MVSLTARNLLYAIKNRQISAPPANYDEDLQWSLNLFQAALDLVGKYDNCDKQIAIFDVSYVLICAGEYTHFDDRYF